MPVHPIRLITVLLATLAVTGWPAAAQQGPPTPASTNRSPRVVLSLGAASANPIHGDDYDEGVPVIGSLAVALTSRLSAEAEISWRSASRAFVTEDVFLYGGPTGIPGRADRFVLGEETGDLTAGLNAVFRTTPRLIGVFAGGGAMFHHEQFRRYRTVVNCTPPIPSSGFECAAFDERNPTRDFGLQGIAGVDVRLHPRMSGYAQLRYEMRPDLGMGTIGVGGGVRVVLR